MRNIKFFIFVLILFCAFKVSADSDRIENPSNNHYYQYFDTKMLWHDAKNYCNQIGGYLATVSSKEENTFLYNKFNNEEYCWIGGSDENKEGTWEWVTGEVWEYSNWETREPSNHGETEDYLELFRYSSGLWNNDFKDVENTFICEWDNADIICDYTDSDSDGVINQFDNCPDTPVNSAIYSNGCRAIDLYKNITELSDSFIELSTTYSDLVHEYNELTSTINNMYTKDQMDKMVLSILEWGDINKDDKISLQEIIHKLMIISGVIK